mgnify:CR=1 FL=1
MKRHIISLAIIFVMLIKIGYNYGQHKYPARIISSSADPDANIIFGTTIREDLGDDIQISVIAAGFDSLRHYNPISTTNSFFKPTITETQPSPSVIPSVAEESHPIPPKTASASKYKLQHDEVNIEDDLDIPTFLRNKF